MIFAIKTRFYLHEICGQFFSCSLYFFDLFTFVDEKIHWKITWLKLTWIVFSKWFVFYMRQYNTQIFFHCFFFVRSLTALKYFEFCLNANSADRKLSWLVYLFICYSHWCLKWFLTHSYICVYIRYAWMYLCCCVFCVSQLEQSHFWNECMSCEASV